MERGGSIAATLTAPMLVSRVKRGALMQANHANASDDESEEEAKATSDSENDVLNDRAVGKQAKRKDLAAYDPTGGHQASILPFPSSKVLTESGEG